MKRISRQWLTAIIYVVMLHFASGAQRLEGRVLLMDKNAQHITLRNVKVYLKSDSTLYTLTDTNGNFRVHFDVRDGDWLYARYPGFDLDSQQIEKGREKYYFMLSSTLQLNEILIIARNYDTEIELFHPIKIEKINQAELKKAACCNLAESFESNASVDVVYADAISGARAIQMLGLSGIYTQMLTENIPLMRGLSSNFGLTYIPGPWVESIQITKGIGSVVNGYESMSGAINIEYLKPEDNKVDNYFVNLYGNYMGRTEANLHYRKSFNKNVSTLLMGHASGMLRENDHNHDGFLDNPKGYQVNVFNRWKIQHKKTEQIIGLRVVDEDKTGGQTDSHIPVTPPFYTVNLHTRLAEVFVKNGFLFPESKFATLGLIASGKYQENNNRFGDRSYTGSQRSAYFNGIYQNILFNSLHQVRTGVSGIYDDYHEKYNDSVFNHIEMIPGVFAEYTGNPEGEFTFMAGGRIDYHNQYGVKYTWRTHAKWNPDKHSSFRLLAGTGFRTAHVFMENTSVMASSRQVMVDPALKPEESFNTGASYTFRFQAWNQESSVNLDYYYTTFRNQVVVDMDADVHEIHFYNLANASYSHSAQADVDLRLSKSWQVKMAYKYYYVQTRYQVGWRSKPLIPTHRAMLTVSYTSRNRLWNVDYIANGFGSTRIPVTTDNPYALRFPEKSKPYLVAHIQVTRKFRKWEVYAGVENLGSFTQRHAIIDASNPFGTYFDASMIWGPLNSRNYYAGLRYGLKK